MWILKSIIRVCKPQQCRRYTRDTLAHALIKLTEKPVRGPQCLDLMHRSVGMRDIFLREVHKLSQPRSFPHGRRYVYRLYRISVKTFLNISKSKNYTRAQNFYSLPFLPSFFVSLIFTSSFDTLHTYIS